ncbi:MAG: adenylate/guanylate cyclase domain-containing protein [Chloroflexota bacterium]
MICGACGTENRTGRKFCSECAAALSVACPSCGAANEPSEKFCGECATPLAPGAAPRVSPGPPGSSATGPASGPRPTSGPVAERRLVSVLFADLVGFTPFAEERDAEDVRDTLNRYFEVASEVITRYGGTVEKFIGDAVMAVWGAPVARENDAERSVRAALELVDAVRALGPGIQARAGVLTGEAAVTIGATNQGMVAGDLVNTAARLQSVAQPGTVLVGEPTMRAASGAIAFEEAGEQALKGKAAPVPAWRALRVVAEIGGRNRSDALEAPFVGRDDELRLLKELFHATGREGKARLVSVIGPAGIGKSRLSWEFSKYADGVVENVWWHTGRSPSYGEGITFWALGEMVRRRSGLVETDDERTTRSKIAESLATHVPDEAERRWIEPALLALLGVGTGTGGSEQFFGAWRTFFERMAETGTVALVFEDLHWADTGTLDFIDHLLEWSRSSPIFIVTLARPELLERRSDWGAGKRNFSSLYLEPLSEPAMRELLAGLIPGLPERAVRAIVGRADGIPLYAVETVRMLLAEGKLRLDGERYVPTGDLSDLAVPETLTALIASRLDGLSAEDRAIITDGAVLGQSFTPAGLAAVSGVPEAELEPRLRGLVRRELLVSEADPRSPERGQYAFVQALIREVAYHTLAKRDRKTRHLAAARFFETLGSDEMAGALATHYLAAHANAPAGGEAEALAVQARIALKAAADRAIALGAHDQAVAFLQQAITVTADPAEEAELLDRAAESASIAAHQDIAAELLGRSVELRRAGGNRSAVASSIAALGRVLLGARRTDEALALLTSSSEELADLHPDPGFLALEGQLAAVLSQTEQHRRAIEVSDRVLEAAEHADLPKILAETLVTKGRALGSLGRLREAIGVLRAGEELARALGWDSIVLRALISRGFHVGEIDARAALEAYQDGLALARRLGQQFMVLAFANNVGFMSFLSGNWDEGVKVFDEALGSDLEPRDRVALLGNYIVILACRGEPVAELVREMIELHADDTDAGQQSMVADAQGHVAWTSGNLQEARTEWLRLGALAAVYIAPATYQAARPAIWERDVATVRRDLEAIDATGFHGAIVETRRTTLNAAIAALEGRTGEAHELYREAIRGWHELGQPWDGAVTAVDMAHVLDPSDPEVQAAGAIARKILEGMGAVPIIERLDAALARGRSEAGQSHASSTEAAAPVEDRFASTTGTTDA